MAKKDSNWDKHESCKGWEKGLFPDSDPLNSDENQLEVNQIKCCLYDKWETWS